MDGYFGMKGYNVAVLGSCAENVGMFGELEGLDFDDRDEVK